MSHELEMVNGMAQMAYAGDTPWHRLGVKVSNDLTPLEMMDKAVLNWEVHKHDLMIAGLDVKVPGKQALLRSTDNKFMDVIGDDWQPVQNANAFEFFTEFVTAGDMEMNTAGSLKGGRNVWALAKVKESFTILGKDQIDSYLLFSNPHQYGKAIDIRFTPIRVVCNNTLTMSLNGKSKNQVKLNHRSTFDAETVKQTLGIAHNKFAEYKEMAELLASKKYKPDTLVEYYNEVFPHTYSKDVVVKGIDDLTKTAKTAIEVIQTQPGAELGAGSWWAAFNAVTYLTDHKMGRSDDSRMDSAWFGINQSRKIKAAELAVKFAKAA